MTIKFRRRHFIQILGATGIASFIFSFKNYLDKKKDSAEFSSTAPSGLSILQGPTSPDQTQISICLPAPEMVQVYALTQSGQRIEPTKFLAYTELFADHQFLNFIFTHLSLTEKYTLIVLNSEGKELDRRQFSTLDTNKKDFKAALISCAHDRNEKEQLSMWQSVEKSKPDVMFFLGDNVYVDWHDKDNDIIEGEPYIWSRYIRVRNLLYLYKMPTLIPAFATWDDHDTGTNDGNKYGAHIQSARKIFEMAFPQQDIGQIFKRTYGVASHLKIFGLDILIMDSRSFRTSGEDPEATHWGTLQEGWVESTLKTATNPVWILNGTQFFGAYRGPNRESFEWVHPNKFDWFKSLIKASAAPVLLTSGDIHYSEIQKIEKEVVGYPLFEITSSSIHSRKKYETLQSDNRRDYVIEKNIDGRRLAVTGQFNFVLAQVSVHQNHMNVNAKSIGQESTVYFDKDIKVSKTV